MRDIPEQLQQLRYLSFDQRAARLILRALQVPQKIINRLEQEFGDDFGIEFLSDKLPLPMALQLYIPSVEDESGFHIDTLLFKPWESSLYRYVHKRFQELLKNSEEFDCFGFVVPFAQRDPLLITDYNPDTTCILHGPDSRAPVWWNDFVGNHSFFTVSLTACFSRYAATHSDSYIGTLLESLIASMDQTKEDEL